MHKILLISSLINLLFLSGCGNEKSAGEQMADAVSAIRGDRPQVSQPTPTISTDKPKKEVSSSQPQTEDVTKTSLKSIVHQAIDEIKEVENAAQ